MMKYNLKILGKVFISCFWLIIFYVRDLSRKTTHALEDLNEMHISTTIHADRRSLRGLTVSKIDIFGHFGFLDCENVLKTILLVGVSAMKFGTLIEQKMLYRMIPKHHYKAVVYRSQ